uniref:Uncharacterized protein n=1 Tax=Peronospora matthiolae TaxID=2874970 RepID=A0AAV1U686_9STRA
MAATTEPTKKTPGGVPRATPGRGSRDDKILAALTDRLASLESSQKVRDEEERVLGGRGERTVRLETRRQHARPTDDDRHDRRRGGEGTGAAWVPARD